MKPTKAKLIKVKLPKAELLKAKLSDWKYAKELLNTSLQIAVLQAKKHRLINRFAIANSDRPMPDFIKAIFKFGGVGAAVRWYVRAYEVNVLEARRIIFKMCTDNN